LLEALQVFSIQRLCGSEIHGYTMLHNPVLIKDSVEDLQRLAAVDHVVLGDNFEPGDCRFLGKNVVVVRNA
jgi:hypothetical protein